MGTIGERIKCALEAFQSKDKSMSQSRLEREAGWHRGELSQFVKRKSNRIDPQKLSETARLLGVSFEWLATGQGDMHQDDHFAQHDFEDEKELLVKFARACGVTEMIIQRILNRQFASGGPKSLKILLDMMILEQELFDNGMSPP